MKTSIRISAVLSAVAVGIVSYANATISPWFDAGISNYDSWPTDGSNVSIAGQGTWSGTTNATLEASSPKALAVNTDGEGRLTFTAETQVDAAASNAVYSATMTFPGGPDLDALDDPGEGIKAGLAVATTNGVLVFCGRAKDPEGSTNIWVALSGATPVVDVSTAVQVSLKTEGEVLKAQYAVNGTVLTYENSEWLALASADKILNGSKFAGTGFNLSALSATTDDGIVVTATLTLPELPENVSGVSVTTNGVAIEGVEGVYTVVQGDSVTVTFVAAEGYAFSGDSSIVLVMDSDKTLNQDDIPAAAALNSFIKINEIMASNPSVDKGGITNDMGIAEMDWIELYNAASVDIDVTGWYLSDNDKVGKEDKATILGSCVIPAGGYKIVWLDKIHTNATEYAAGEAFAVLKLSSSGDLIQLADKSKTVVDKINFKEKPQIKGYSYGPGTISYGPQAGTVTNVYMKTATPGAPNVLEGWGDFTPEVSFSVPHGYKTEAFDLELSCAADP
nr:lamin tail domain-containing protein [Kiritimatiellia bacterium]